MIVAIQGYEGSFHQLAARDYFGPGMDMLSCRTFRDVARAVEEGRSDFGVIAIENSIAGSIIANYNILQNDSLQVCGEVYLRIFQNLMVLPEVEMCNITEVHSHPMAFLQCLDFLEKHPWKLVETEDTAFSARRIAEQGLAHAAAIGGELAAELFGLKIIAPEINTIQNNYTRFMILRRRELTIDPGANKASLYFKTDHTKGSLLKVLRQMEHSTINLSKLQSYPIPSEPWHYLFHADLEFDTLDDYFLTLERLRQVTEEVHVYGVYASGRVVTDREISL